MHKMPKHTKFIWNPGDGIFELEANRSLRIATIGRGPASRLIIKLGKAAVHEKFIFRDRAVFLTENQGMCLGSETKTLEDGARIVLQDCELQDGQPVPHQAFIFGLDKRIKALGSGLCMIVKDNNMKPGAEIVLGECGEHSGFIGNKVFVQSAGKVQVKSRTDLHFNVQQAAVGGPIVLWKSEIGRDESFEFVDGRLKPKDQPKICLVPLGGLSPGQRLSAVMCTADGVPEEQFHYDDDRHCVASTVDPNMVFNVKGGAMQPGDEVVLWPVDESSLQKPAEEL